MAGEVRDCDYCYTYLAIGQYNANGLIDSDFGDGGIVKNMNRSCVAAAIQPDQKIVAAGKIFNGNYNAFGLVRFNSDGSIDSIFGLNGLVETSFPNGNAEPFSVSVGSDNKIVVGGFSYNGTNKDFTVARYLSGLDVGIADLSSAQTSILTYPNPIQETELLQYTLRKDEVLNLSLYDVNGKLMKNFFINESRIAGEHREELNFGNLAAGNYLLTLSNGWGKVSVKMVKQ